jgi:hypothetical protein
MLSPTNTAWSMNIDNAKSYATEENLMKALTKLGFAEDRPLIVRNREGRYTAVFGFHLSGLGLNGGYLAKYASQGFLTID